MRIIVFGADGYLGWPMSMRLSALGHDVVAADSLVRRDWEVDSGSNSLSPIASMEGRIKAWRQCTGEQIRWAHVDLGDPAQVYALLGEFEPEAVVHFAEQRSAPFSMAGRSHAVMTQVNNIAGTLNLLFALHELAPDCHLVKLGTMGEYGTPNIDIEDGFLEIHRDGRRDVLPFPKQPGSFYHVSAAHNSDNIMLACKIWRMRASVLNLGIVYGLSTPECDLHSDLTTRFDYDTVWGTVLNRFCVQAAIGKPLTVYGKGGQTRGYLDIRDTLAGIEIALDNPARPGEFRVFNQFFEQFSLNDLAERVVSARARHGLKTRVQHVPTPRAELEEHYYSAQNHQLLRLGLKPHLLQNTLIDNLTRWVEARADDVDPVLLQEPSVDWRTGGNRIWRSYARQEIETTPAGASLEITNEPAARSLSVLKPGLSGLA